MIVFREHTPKRKEITRVVANHQAHRDDLQNDFHNRCGYCNDIKLGNSEFEIDHFVPQTPSNFETTINSTAYFNLVFACKSCNRAKSNKWPTNIESIPNKDNEGFIDPCDNEYDNQYNRTITGRIIHVTPLGKWMYNALKLYKPQHEIIWKIDQLELMIIDIKQLQISSPDDLEIKNRLIKVYDDFYEYLQKLSIL